MKNRKNWICIIGLLLFTCLALPLKADAKEVKKQMEVSGILQNGDLLTEKEESKIATFSLTSPDYEGAKEAIKDGLNQVKTEINLKAYEIPVAEIGTVYSDVLNKNPKYFYVGNTFEYSFGLDGLVGSIKVTYVGETNQVKEMADAYDQAVAKILAGTEDSWSSLEKALYVNDYLATHCQYDTTYSKYSAYDVFVNHTAVCQGYALAFLECMNQLHVPCELVTSNSLNHAWNLVQVDGFWYHVDVTWNDSLDKIDEKLYDRLGRARHYYFLKSENWFLDANLGNHAVEDYVFTESIEIGFRNNTAFDDSFWNSVDAPFGYYNGYWYGNESGSLKYYQKTGEGLVYTGTLKIITEKWPVIDQAGYTWNGNYSGCYVYSGKIYYALPQAIHAVDCVSKEDTIVYNLTDTELVSGRIYGIAGDEGSLTYGLASSPKDSISTTAQLTIHTHSFGGWTTVKAPTCKEAGSEERYCTTEGCTAKETKPIEALGHDYSSEFTVDKEATCMEEGSKSRHCSRCNETTEVTPIEKADHSFGEWKVVKAPTCTEAGSEERYCTAEGCTAKETKPIEALGHDFSSEFTVDKEATCMEEGSKSRHCSRCDETTEETPIEKADHSFGEWKVVKAPTCTEAGSEERYCTAEGCTAKETKPIEALGHAFSSDFTVDKKPTCIEEGSKSRHCSRCGETKEVTPIEKLAHSYGNWERVEEPTCKEAGTEERYCTTEGCTAKETKPIEALGHAFSSDFTVDKKPTCMEEGSKSKHCSRCSETTEETPIEKLAHSYGNWERVEEPTCTEAGSEERYCTAEGCTAKETKPIEALGHVFSSDFTVDKKPTCMEEGSKSKHCSRCSETTEETPIEKVDHSFGEWQVVKAPTCTEAGTEESYCTTEGCTAKETKPKEALGHAFASEFTVDKAPTCVAEGSKSKHCIRCSAKTDVTVIGKSAHIYGTWKVTKNPTCTGSGTRERACTTWGCKAKETQSIVPTGHLHQKTATTAATFVKTGKTVTTCTDCGQMLNTRILAKIPCKKNQIYTVENYKYKIISPKTNGKGTVAVAGLAKNITKVVIGNTVSIKGAKFSIVQVGDKAFKNKSQITSITIGTNVQTIGKEAFYGTKKLKTMTIKSAKITKVGSNALKNVYKKAVIKVLKSKLKKYQSLFAKKGQANTVKITK